MSKYIKQDKAIKIVESHYRVDNDLLEVIAYQISNLPPEDVQPVVHGEWIKKRDSDLYYCSECDLPSMHKWAFCEQCGAKMDKRKGADNG